MQTVPYGGASTVDSYGHGMLVLFVVTMKRQIRHMIKYRYLPFSLGKKTYKAGKAPGASN